jgi:hypothetical protein
MIGLPNEGKDKKDKKKKSIKKMLVPFGQKEFSFSLSVAKRYSFPHSLDS